MNLDGEWAVECRGWAAIFNPLNDHKVILDGQGFNRAVGIEGAYFHCYELGAHVGSEWLETCLNWEEMLNVLDDPLKPADGKKFILDYNHLKNHEFFRDIIDIVTISDEGTSKGTLYKAGRPKFEFTLTRVK